jgi:hypothetical protein
MSRLFPGMPEAGLARMPDGADTGPSAHAMACLHLNTCCSAYAGNFESVALECLQNLKELEEKFTISADQHTFNFLVHSGYGACVVRLPLVGSKGRWDFMPPSNDNTLGTPPDLSSMRRQAMQCHQ